MLKGTCVKCNVEFPEDMLHDVVGQMPQRTAEHHVIVPVAGPRQIKAQVCQPCLSEIISQPAFPTSMGCRVPAVDEYKMESFFRAIEDDPGDIMRGTVRPTKKEN